VVSFTKSISIQGIPKWPNLVLVEWYKILSMDYIRGTLNLFTIGHLRPPNLSSLRLVGAVGARNDARGSFSQYDQDSNPGSFDLELSAQAIEFFCFPNLPPLPPSSLKRFFKLRIDHSGKYLYEPVTWCIIISNHGFIHITITEIMPSYVS